MKALLRRLRDEDSGVVAVLAALCMTVLMGFAALAVDSGSLYVQRTQMQKAVDGAALAGAYDIGTNTQNAADATTYAGRNGVASSELTANHYVATFAANDSWTVSASRRVNLAFAPFLGINQGTINVSATAINSPAKGIPGDALLPYAIWGGNVPVNLGAGASVTYRDNGYVDDVGKPLPNGDPNPNWTGNSNDFKGFIDHGSGTINVGTNVSDGGNADEKHYEDIICQLAATGSTGVFPVIDSESGNGSHITLHIVGFVAVTPNRIPHCSGREDMSQPFTGTVIGGTTWNATPGGGTNPNFPVVRVLKLWQ